MLMFDHMKGGTRYLLYLILGSGGVLFSISYIAFVAGLVGGVSTWVACLVVVFVAVMALVFWREYLIRLILISVLAFSIAYFRTEFFEQRFNDFEERFIEVESGDISSIKFEVISDPQEGHYNTVYTVRERIRQVGSGGVSTRISIKVKTPRYPVYGVGDTCVIGDEYEVFQLDEGYGRYLKSKGVVALVETYDFTCRKQSLEFSFLSLRSTIWDVKSSITSEVESILLEPQSSLLLGMIFGDDRLFSAEFESYLKVSGTTHIIAASGFNVTVLYLFVERVLGRYVGLRKRAVLTIILIWLFAIFANLSGSILRATVMLSIYLLHRVLGVRYSVFDSLMYAVALLLLVSPNLVLDVGLQLSVAATLGILLIYEPVVEFLGYLRDMMLNFFKRFEITSKDRLPDYIQNACATIAATSSTLPVSSAAFDSGSFFGVLPNFIVLNLVEPIYYLGVVALLVHYAVSKSLAKYFFIFLDFLLRLFTFLIRWFGHIGDLEAFAFLQSDLLIYGNFIFICIIVAIRIHSSVKDSFIVKYKKFYRG